MDYARAILRLAEEFSAPWRPEMTSAMLCRSGVGVRIRILCSGKRRFPGDWPMLLIGAALMALLLFSPAVQLFSWMYFFSV